MNKRRLAAGTAIAAVVASAGVVGGMAMGGDSPERRAAATQQPPVVLADSLDLLDSGTVEDWVSYGSAVAVVTVVDERAGQVLEDDLARGEGTINRDIVMQVDERLWTREGANLPDQITISTTGWAWSDGQPEKRVEFGNAGRPRYEVGRQYLVALAKWPGTPKDQLANCEDEPEEGGWAPIGEYASTPVTNGIVGVGEFEGTVRTLGEALEDAKSPAEAIAVEGGTLRSHLYGKTVQSVVPQLKVAAETVKPKEIPTPGC